MTFVIDFEKLTFYYFEGKLMDVKSMFERSLREHSNEFFIKFLMPLVDVFLSLTSCPRELQCLQVRSESETRLFDFLPHVNEVTFSLAAKCATFQQS